MDGGRWSDGSARAVSRVAVLQISRRVLQAIFLPLSEQQHNLYGVVDFKVGKIDVDFGVAYGFTHGSDRLIAKIVLGYAFPVPGANEKDNDQLPKTPPTLKSARALLQ